LRILQLVPYFPPYIGGQERYVYNLSKYLVRMGHEVHIVTSNFPKTKEHEIIEGITVERYRCLARPLRNPITPGFLTLGKKIKEFDVVHTHNEHSFAAMMATYFRRRTNVPLILTCHGQLRFGNFFADKFESIYSRSVGRRILDTVDAICVNSTMDKDYLLSLDRDLITKIKVLSNAIDPQFLENLDSKPVHSELVEQIKCDSKIILYVGRLIRRKGLEWLIKAINIIVNELNRNDISVVLVGNGEDKTYFRDLVNKYCLNNRVLFLGEMSDCELVHYYKNSNVFVLPSLSEVCPTVVLEAMYFGLPVIATDIPGVKDHFNDVALLVPPKNENRLADAIIKLLDDEKLKGRLSKTGEELVKRKYTWDVVSREYEKVYIELLRCKG